MSFASDVGIVSFVNFVSWVSFVSVVGVRRVCEFVSLRCSYCGLEVLFFIFSKSYWIIVRRNCECWALLLLMVLRRQTGGIHRIYTLQQFQIQYLKSYLNIIHNFFSLNLWLSTTAQATTSGLRGPSLKKWENLFWFLVLVWNYFS